MTAQIICYFRVSTEKQGRSGLGLEGQKAAVAEYTRRHDSNVLAAYTEVESGRRSDRPALARAMAHAKRARALLLVAKIDRLARNLAFLAALMETGVEFVACDNPHANRLTIHILAAVAEDEARRISERTKAALAAYKRRGGVLGASRPECRNLSADARRKGAKAAGAVVRMNADAAYLDLADILRHMRQAGASYQAIADRLNADGHTTRAGKPWNATAAWRVCKRLRVS